MKFVNMLKAKQLIKKQESNLWDMNTAVIHCEEGGKLIN